MHLPSATMQTDRTDPGGIGKTAQMHRSRQHKSLIATPYKIKIVLSNADILSHLPAPQSLPPKPGPDTFEVVPVSPPAADDHVVAKMADPKPATVDAADVSDDIVCRPPQQLPASRFLGPKTCRPRALWAQYRKEGLDIAPDGIRVVADSLESTNASVCPLMSTGGNSTYGLRERFSATGC
jgi:hypothetical protein